MPPVYRIVEITIYALLNFIPFMALALYPFRNHFRYSKRKTAVLMGLISLVQVGLGLVSTFSGGSVGFLSVISTVIYALFYFAVVKAHYGKILFTLLMLSNIANFVVTSSKCLEGLIFGSIAYESYRYTFSVTMAVVELIVLVPLFFYIRSTYSSIFEKKIAKSTWRLLWMIPVTFYLVWYHHMYGTETSSLEIALRPDHTVMLLFINLGAVLIYHIVVQHIKIIDSNTALVEQNHLLAMQNLQYENLQERINEARRAKHDVRHHITIMDNLLKIEDYDGLHEYLQSYKRSLPDESSIVLCNHYATNTLLLFFAQQAQKQNVDFETSVSLPKEINIPDNVLSVVLGNLLENALEACAMDEKEQNKISIKGTYKRESGSLFFQIENTYSGKYILDKKGRYMSTKHPGRGLGLISVQDIVAKHEGMIEIHPGEEMFTVSVLMMAPEE